MVRAADRIDGPEGAIDAVTASWAIPDRGRLLRAGPKGLRNQLGRSAASLRYGGAPTAGRASQRRARRGRASGAADGAALI